MDLGGSWPSRLGTFGWELIFGRGKLRRVLAVFEFFEIGSIYAWLLVFFFGKVFWVVGVGN